MSVQIYKHLRVQEDAQRKALILARVLGVEVYKLVDHWTENEWQAAVKDGLVNEKMLEDVNLTARHFTPAAKSIRGKQ